MRAAAGAVAALGGGCAGLAAAAAGATAGPRGVAAGSAVVVAAQPDTHFGLARQLVQEVTPEAEARIAAATAEVLDILAALSGLAARVERLRASGRQHQHAPTRDIPEDITKWKPGDSFSMPGDLGGEFFETSQEAFFWGQLDLLGLREDLAAAVASLGRDLGDAAATFNAWTRAEELLARLPGPMLDALRSRLAELAAPKSREPRRRGRR